MNSLLVIVFSILSSIYQLTIVSVDGQQISLSTCQGKNILLVNIATGSSRVDQIGKLQELQEQYADSLIVIAIPSNSFNNEPLDNGEIKSFCLSNYQTTFLIASKCSVLGSSAHPVYQWLASADSNGVAAIPVGGDFEKFLINRQGALVGIFSGAVDPLSAEITQAIEGN